MKLSVLVMTLAVLGTSACTDDTQTDLSAKAASLARMVAAGDDHVTVQELSDWLIKDRRDFELVDIRASREFDAAHIEGARHIPLAGLLAEQALNSLPVGRTVVVYSNGSAHAAQAALLLRLAGREAVALLGGYNYWHAYLNDPEKAGVTEMDAAQRAQYQAVACYFAGEYVAAAGLTPKGGMITPPPSSSSPQQDGNSDALGLGLGLGSDQVQQLQLPTTAPPSPATEQADPLGLGLGLGLGSDEVRKASQPDKAEPGKTRKLLIRAEC
jgi:rhodanese-related sulfurtransferase